MARQFYVYIIRDPRPGKDNAPIYVGKGRRDRARSHFRKTHNRLLKNIIEQCKTNNLRPIIDIVSYFDDETEAFSAEIELISKYGRRDLKTGTLCNMTDGGEGVRGCQASADNMRRLNSDPAFVLANREAVRKARAANPDYDEARKAGVRRLFSNPERVKEYAIRGAEKMRKLNADPVFLKENAQRASDRLKRLHADPEYAKANAERAGEKMRKLHKTPEFARATSRRASERMKRLNADPEFQDKCQEAQRRKVAERKLIQANQARPLDLSNQTPPAISD